MRRRDLNILYDKNVIHCDNINIVYALGLELIISLNVPGDLGTAGACKCTRDTNLNVTITTSSMCR